MTDSKIVLTSILSPQPLVEMALSYDRPPNNANKRVLRQYIPHGVTAWRTSHLEAWSPLAELPAVWGLADKSEGLTPEEMEAEVPL